MIFYQNTTNHGKANLSVAKFLEKTTNNLIEIEQKEALTQKIEALQDKGKLPRQSNIGYQHNCKEQKDRVLDLEDQMPENLTNRIKSRYGRNRLVYHDEGKQPPFRKNFPRYKLHSFFKLIVGKIVNDQMSAAFDSGCWVLVFSWSKKITIPFFLFLKNP